jgi:hypothetical protein
MLMKLSVKFFRSSKKILERSNCTPLSLRLKCNTDNKFQFEQNIVFLQPIFNYYNNEQSRNLYQ